MEAKRRIAKLIALYLHGQLSAEQQEELNSWMNKSPKNQQLFQTLIDSSVVDTETGADGQLQKETWEKVVNLIPELATASRPRINWRKWSIAASLVVMGMAGWYFYRRLESKPFAAEEVSSKVPYLSHQEQAILRLSDNKEIALDAAAQGMLTTQGDITVHKVENGQLIYSTDTSSISKAKQDGLYNTISTSKGSQYQVRLPDGTTVWLNSVSSLRFPVCFSGDVREVFVTGEAYFEVSQQPLAVHGNKKNRKSLLKKPFIVHANGIQVEVVGTHFNINAYVDEPSVKTTLLEGKVKVRSSALAPTRHTTLRPGQQASLSKEGRATISYPNLDDVISWKNGIITFEFVPLQQIMRQIERWHDVKVIYEGPVPTDKFYINLYREQSLSGLLKVLVLTEKFHYRIEGKRIIITP